METTKKIAAAKLTFVFKTDEENAADIYVTYKDGTSLKMSGTKAFNLAEDLLSKIKLSGLNDEESDIPELTTR